MKFSLSTCTTFFLVFVSGFFHVFCGDGIGDNILKIWKTTTPLRRPQKNGYFLNIHEEENIEGIQKDAIEKGLESRMEKMKNELESYYDDTINESKELRSEKYLRRKIDLANSALNSLKETKESLL